MSFAIAIDGPAGAGKSTAARKAAENLNFIYVDTGAMYRTIGLYMLENNVPADNEDALKNALDQIQIELKYKDGVQCMFLNGEDVSGIAANVTEPAESEAGQDSLPAAGITFYGIWLLLLTLSLFRPAELSLL